jgi:hypothetical protein
MNERWRLAMVGTSARLERLVEGRYVIAAYLDPVYAREIVDTLNAVPIAHLQKQVAVMSDAVDDILARVTTMQRGVRAT